LKQQEASKTARLKLKTLREMNDQDLADKLSELKADLAKLKLEKSKGTCSRDHRPWRKDSRINRSNPAGRQWYNSI
jgi:large subunit ribosomal protein L29